MPRKSDVEEVETEEVAAPAEGAEAKTPKAKKEPKRGELPEGYVTPVGLAKILTEKGLHKNRDGETVDVKPQMVYSYIKNATKDDPFPVETIKDSIDADRQVVNTEKGLEWWERKNARVAERAANAKAKDEAKAAKAAAKASAEEAEDSAPAEEAE